MFASSLVTQVATPVLILLAGASALFIARVLAHWLATAGKRTLGDIVRENSPPVDPEMIRPVIQQELEPIRKEFLVNGGLTARDAINRIEGRLTAIEGIIGHPEHE